MPTPFHFLIHTDKWTIQTKRNRLIETTLVSEGIRNLLQGYVKGIHKQNNWTGSLFQQNTKQNAYQKEVGDGEICFYYNHQNPMKAGSGKRMEDGEYSSVKDYAGLYNETFCNKNLAFQLSNLNPTAFYHDSYAVIHHESLKNISNTLRRYAIP